MFIRARLPRTTTPCTTDPPCRTPVGACPSAAQRSPGSPRSWRAIQPPAVSPPVGQRLAAYAKATIRGLAHRGGLSAIGVLAVAMSCPAAWAASTDPLLYVDDSGGRLGTINLKTGETTVIGQTGISQLFDIAFDPTGQRLYGVTPDGLWSIDPKSAESHFIGGRNFGNSGMNALVFHPSGTLYSAGIDGRLYTLDPDTGTASRVGLIGHASSGDLAFGADGQLYMSSMRNALVQIDRKTGAGFEIGPFGYGNVFGLACDGKGLMYGYSHSDIFTVNLDTGKGTFLMNYWQSGLSAAHGGTFRYEAAPEPSSIALALMGAVALTVHAVRRHSRRAAL